jgi:hypothetical protein
MEMRKISDADAPARATMTPVVKNRLNAGATWASPGMITPNSPSWQRCRVSGWPRCRVSGVLAIASPFRVA